MVTRGVRSGMKGAVQFKIQNSKFKITNSPSLDLRTNPTTVLLLALLCSARPLSAQILTQYDYEDLQFRGVGIEVGRVWASEIEPANAFGLRADLGYVGPHLRIEPTARFWSSKLDRSEVNRLSNQIVLVCQRQGNAI